MKRSALALVFTSILVLRVTTGQPERVGAGTRVRLTIPTIDYPEHTESQTVVRRGEWEARIKGYINFIPGEVVEVEGVMDERGRVVESKVLGIKYQEMGLADYILVQIAHVRHWAVGRLQRVLPEPQASLAIGILLGVKRGMPREFYEQLVGTGTLHVVAASGYNVSVVSGVVLATLGLILPRGIALGLSLIGVGLYVMLAGAGTAIVRAGIMGSLGLVGIMLGKMREAKWFLWLTVWTMLMAKPELLFDIGFQLSVSATMGLLYLGSTLNMFARQISNSGVREVVTNYLVPTVAATVATAPVIWGHFGRLSLIGVLVNMLVLPVIPVIMLLSALTVVLEPFFYLLYVPLWWMVMVIRMFG